MIDNLLDYFSNDDDQALTANHQLFGFVVHSLRQQAAGRGDPLPVDVETVFDSIESLARRDQLSTAPFISAWHPLVAEAEATAAAAKGSENPESRLARQLREVIDQQVQREPYRRSTQPSEQFIQDLLNISRQPGMAFRDLADAVLGGLVRVLRLDEHNELKYLVPLLELLPQQGCLHVATLNYDVTIEAAGRQAGIPIDTGMSKWPEQQAVTFDSKSVNLYKLHGSVSWERVPKELLGARGMLPFDRIRELPGGEEPRLPSVIFGAGNKLVAGGPYLDLLRRFERALEEVRVLMVAGYSFRDDHVNAVITKWLNYNPASWYDSPSRRLLVLDPGVPHWDRRDHTPALAHHLLTMKEDQPKRLRFVSKGAAQGLSEAILFAQAESWLIAFSPCGQHARRVPGRGRDSGRNALDRFPKSIASAVTARFRPVDLTNTMKRRLAPGMNLLAWPISLPDSVSARTGRVMPCQDRQ